MKLGRHLRPASLSARITLLLVLISLAVLGAGSKWMDWRIDHAMEARFRQNVLNQALALRAIVQMDGRAGTHSPLPAYAGTLHHGDATYYEVRCPGLPTRESTPALSARPPGWPATATAQPAFKTVHHRHAHLVVVQLAFAASADPRGAAAPECRLVFAQDRSAMDELLGEIDWILLLAPGLALLMALVAVPLIVRHGMRPVGALVAQMAHIGPNAPGQRLTPSGVRELDPLTARFNDVLTRMDDGLARERQFAAGLAHETRTRLAELRALAEVESRYPSGRSLPDVLAEVRSIGGELEATVVTLLLLTRLQSGIEQPRLEPLALAPWLTHQRERWSAAAQARAVTVHAELAPDVVIQTDPGLLEVVVGNLLANAGAYAPAGDTVRLALAADHLSVDNAAPGLAADDLPNLGQRFWRKQAPQAAHAGLGLALATAAAQALGLALTFRLGADGRLVATLEWPPAGAAAPAADA